MLKEVKLWQFYQFYILVAAFLVLYCGSSYFYLALIQFNNLYFSWIWIYCYKPTYLVCFLSELGGVWYNKGYNNLLFLNSLNLFTGLEFFTEFLTTMPRNASVWFATKLLICISMLIFVRGGLPRYRYDYLTKIGWLKFLGFTFIVFFYTLLFFILY